MTADFRIERIYPSHPLIRCHIPGSGMTAFPLNPLYSGYDLPKPVSQFENENKERE